MLKHRVSAEIWLHRGLLAEMSHPQSNRGFVEETQSQMFCSWLFFFPPERFLLSRCCSLCVPPAAGGAEGGTVQPEWDTLSSNMSTLAHRAKTAAFVLHNSLILRARCWPASAAAVISAHLSSELITQQPLPTELCPLLSKSS